MIQDQKHWGEILITRVSSGSTPKYQTLLFVNFCLKWLLAGMILFSLNFFYITPQFQCAKSELQPGQSCQQYVCTLTQQQWQLHLKPPIPSSISLDYGIIMLCHNKWLSSLLQSLSYLGSFLGYIIMAYIADNYGRKNTQRAAWVINILGLSILVASRNLAMVGIGSFMMGFGTNAAITLHYTFLKELLTGKMRERSFIIVQIAFSVGVGLVALGSWFVPNWKIVAGVMILLPCILIFPFGVWIIQQTPNFSLKHGRQVLLQSMNRIAKMNNQDQLTSQDIQFIPSPRQQSQSPSSSSDTPTSYSLIDLFRYKSLRNITIICGMINLIIQFIYDGTILSLDKIGVNVYLDQILVGFVEVFAAAFCSWIVVRVRRNAFLKLCLILVAIFTTVIGLLALLFQHKDNQINFHVVAEMIVLACLRFVMNSMWGLFFVYVSELFPANVISITFGWISLVGTVGAFSSPFIRLWTAKMTYFFMAGLCVVVFFFTNQLRETKGQKCVQQIEQRQAQNHKKSIQSQSQKQSN